MRTLKVILIFYKKLIVPTLLISIVSGLGWLMTYGKEVAQIGFGLTYVFIAPLMHYFIYEVKYSNEYYFYYNLGITKLTLWVSTLILSIIIALTSIILWTSYM